MSRTGGIQVEGIVIEARPNGTYQVELPNGHRLTAFIGGRARLELASLAAGDRVKLEMSLYDLSEGRVIAR